MGACIVQASIYMRFLTITCLHNKVAVVTKCLFNLFLGVATILTA